MKKKENTTKELRTLEYTKMYGIGGATEYKISVSDFMEYFIIHQSVTGNCQAGGLCYFNAMLDIIYNQKREDIKFLVAYIIRNMSKKLYVIDIRQDLMNTAGYKKFLKDFTVAGKKRVKSNYYESTNGSLMNLTMLEFDFIKLDDIKSKYEQKYTLVWEIKQLKTQ